MFGRKKAERERIDVLEAELAQLRERLEAADRESAALRTNLTGVEATNRSLETRLASICAQGEEITGRLDGVSDEVARVNARITGVSTELANQDTELGNEIDALEQAPSDPGRAPSGTNGHAPDLDVDAIVIRLNDSVDEIVQEVLDEVEESTGRLAAEQARYQIQFRQDLADMADQLRRPRAS